MRLSLHCLRDWRSPKMTLFRLFLLRSENPLTEPSEWLITLFCKSWAFKMGASRVLALKRSSRFACKILLIYGERKKTNEPIPSRGSSADHAKQPESS